MLFFEVLPSKWAYSSFFWFKSSFEMGQIPIIYIQSVTFKWGTWPFSKELQNSHGDLSGESFKSGWWSYFQWTWWDIGQIQKMIFWNDLIVYRVYLKEYISNCLMGLISMFQSGIFKRGPVVYWVDS